MINKDDLAFELDMAELQYLADLVFEAITAGVGPWVVEKLLETGP